MNTHGGARPNSGRKTKLPEHLKKSALFVYPTNEEIELLGGKDAVKELCQKYITKAVMNKKKKNLKIV